MDLRHDGIGRTRQKAEHFMIRMVSAGLVFPVPARPQAGHEKQRPVFALRDPHNGRAPAVRGLWAGL